jgi:alkanesulfonate monooxygenase SsuD/methylene tetrahydromethanopterin reductase-like flavin-dependent oxidoreductase (luciferase family)
MKLGVFLTNQQHLDADMVAAVRDQISLLHAARDAGFDSWFSGQHYLNEGNNKQLQIVPFMSRLIPEAGEMTTGLGILLLNLHNPVYVAETVASMDILCEGRFIYGIGLGYREVEFEAFDVPRGTRVKRFVEYVELIDRLWTEDSVTHHGETCRLENVRMNIRPVQLPRPPLWIAANNDAAIRRAARLGDTWFVNPHSTIDTIRRQMKLFTEERAACGKPPVAELPVIKEIFCAKDRKTAMEQAGPYLFGKYMDYAKWGQDDAMPDDESFDKDFEELIEGRFIIGSPEECYEQLRPYWEELGVNHLVFRTHWAGMPVEISRGSLDLIARELAPELRKVGA